MRKSEDLFYYEIEDSDLPHDLLDFNSSIAERNYTWNAFDVSHFYAN